METDHISEKEIAEAYSWGWDCYPDTRGGNPYKDLEANKILVDAWESGWADAKIDHPAWISVSPGLRFKLK